jgi:hypothetical protein
VPVPDPFTLRWVYRHHWTGLAERADVEPAVARLIDLGWLREVAVPAPGRQPVLAFAINPAVREATFGTSGTESDVLLATFGTFGTRSEVPLPENIHGMEWNPELLALRAREENLEVVPPTQCHRCHNPLAACVCDGPEFIDDARE